MKKVSVTVVMLMLSSLLCMGQPIGIFTDRASVGDDNEAGIATFENDIYEIEGSGNDIWDVPDGFYWIYTEVTGDFTATVTVEWLTGVDEGDTWKKAGFIARNTADDATRTDGEYACSALIKGDLSNFFCRPLADSGEEDTFYNGEEDLSNLTNTIQLTREGNIFSMQRGLVGEGFIELASLEINMLDTILVGLCVTSHNTSTIEAASFSDVSIELGTTTVCDYELY